MWRICWKCDTRRTRYGGKQRKSRGFRLNFNEMIRNLKGNCKKDKAESGDVLAELDASEIARFQEVISREEALKLAIKRAESKHAFDARKMWSDLCDKYDLHGIESTIRDGKIYKR